MTIYMIAVRLCNATEIFTFNNEEKLLNAIFDFQELGLEMALSYCEVHNG